MCIQDLSFHHCLCVTLYNSTQHVETSEILRNQPTIRIVPTTRTSFVCELIVLNRVALSYEKWKITILLYPECQSSRSMNHEYRQLFANYCPHQQPTKQAYPHPILFDEKEQKDRHYRLVIILVRTTHRIKHWSTSRIQSITHHWISYFGFTTI